MTETTDKNRSSQGQHAPTVLIVGAGPIGLTLA